MFLTELSWVSKQQGCIAATQQAQAGTETRDASMCQYRGSLGDHEPYNPK